MKRQVLVLVLSMFSALTMLAADYDDYAETCVVLTRWKNTQKTFGSGFLLARRVAGKSQIFLVTNKHVLPLKGEEPNLTVRFGSGAKSGKTVIYEFKVSILDGNGQYLSTVARHPDADVAAVNITREFFGSGASNTTKVFEVGWLATREQLRNAQFGIGEEVYLLGFPDEVYDQRNLSPVLRSAKVATSLYDGWAANQKLRDLGMPSQIDGFLIDGSVFPGSSGSVVLTKKGMAFVGSRGLTIGGLREEPRILGIVSGSIPFWDSGTKTTQRLNLGIVYFADVIRSTIDLFDETSGLVAFPTRAVRPK